MEIPKPFRVPDRRRGRGPPVKILRRIGDSPRLRGSVTGESCPDIFELNDGNFAVIGTEATAKLDSELPADAARADYERIVVITRETLLRAKRDIPDA
nr:hypothetical protein [Streptomyces sp. SID8379]